jgi:hypothetical protein
MSGTKLGLELATTSASAACSEHRRVNRRGTSVGAYQPMFFDFRHRRRQAHLIASRRYAERGGQPESGFMPEKKVLGTDKKVISFLRLRASVHQCKLPIVAADASAPKDGPRNTAADSRIKQREAPSWLGRWFRDLSAIAWHSTLELRFGVRGFDRSRRQRQRCRSAVLPKPLLVGYDIADSLAGTCALEVGACRSLVLKYIFSRIPCAGSVM